jgi:hypothetical protein
VVFIWWFISADLDLSLRLLYVKSCTNTPQSGGLLSFQWRTACLVSLGSSGQTDSASLKTFVDKGLSSLGTNATSWKIIYRVEKSERGIRAEGLLQTYRYYSVISVCLVWLLLCVGGCNKMTQDNMIDAVS